MEFNIHIIPREIVVNLFPSEGKTVGEGEIQTPDFHRRFNRRMQFASVRVQFDSRTLAFLLPFHWRVPFFGVWVQCKRFTVSMASHLGY